MTDYTSHTYIMANIRNAMKAEDREQADTEKAFWAASGAYDASERAAWQHLQNMKAI